MTYFIPAQRFFPDSIEIVKRYTIPNKDRTKPALELQNFPMVDKNVVYMHGVAALQELFFEYDDLLQRIEKFRELGTEIRMMNQELDKRFSDIADEQLSEQKRLVLAEVSHAETEAEAVKVHTEEEKKRLDIELKEEKILLDYQEELSRSRMALQEQLARESMLKSIEVEKELAEKRESVRRESAEKLQLKKLEYLRELESRKTEFEKEKIRAEVEAKAEQERANEDISLRKLQAQAKLDTQRTIETIKMISHQVTRIIQEFLSRPEQIFVAFGAIFGLFAAYYAFKQLVALLREFIQSHLGKPSLVRETSHSLSWWPFSFSPFSSLSHESISRGLQRMELHFATIVLSDDDMKRVLQLALSTRNTKATSAPYRHVLLHGPPGTGKTLIG